MIQFNLLPDVKLDFIKTQRRKRIVSVVASTMVIGSIAIVVMLFSVVNFIQKKHLSDLNKDIQSNTTKLKSTENLDKILTIQNQLLSLTALHDQKPVSTRLYNYLAEVTPPEISVSELQVDFEAKTMKFTGAADKLSTINTFIDTLKFTNFTVTVDDKPGEPAPAFSSVVLTDFSISEDKTIYNIGLIYDPAIFDSAKAVKLVVPATITTRSEVEKPLFQTSEEEVEFSEEQN